ncbi:molecular chaperone DnaJ [Candidatus Kaiserbacteria bacterium]|nr:MAG: molecular chaperone DnaJ [Candidatus Kaiserbacteria bacterium]
MKDYYQILGLQKSATDSEIKKAFRALAQKYHPDKKTGDEARFKEASEAYAVLGDKKKRAEYDTYGRTFAGGGQQQGASFGGFDFSQFQQGFGGGADGVEFDLGDIFSEVFGGGGRSQARRGRDISMDLELDFKDAAFGIERTVLLNKVGYCSECEGSGAKDKRDVKTCTTCNGKGSVHETRRSVLGTFTSARECKECHGIGKIPKTPCKTCKGKGVLQKQEEIKLAIPAGIDNGEMIRLMGKGEAVQGGTAGDLYIKIHVRPHKDFVRSGKDIRMSLNVKLTDALLGSTYTIPTLEKNVDLKIPAGITHGEVLRIKGKGIPREDSSRGDLLVAVHIDLPKKLSRSAKKLIEGLRDAGI